MRSPRISAGVARSGPTCWTLGADKDCFVEPRLTHLQRDFMAAFFARTPAFYLTGGAALAEFHLGRRTTHDCRTEARLPTSAPTPSSFALG
jgi:hypothetical protein